MLTRTSGARRGYSGSRPDIVKLLRAPASRILDVGCGEGGTGALLRQRFPGAYIAGVECDTERAALAASRLDHVTCGRIDDEGVMASLGAGPGFDIIICADVLEHLVDPLRTLSSLRQLLATDGLILTSIPNVRHVSTFTSLGLLGDWPARDRGIHDRTHLRFFARRNILQLGTAAGLRMEREARNLRLVESWSWTLVPARLLDFWPFRAFFTFQYLHVWRQAPVR